ncbi:MAG TPA: choice-of-anchor D domain-containing protein, partial [Candidatus Kapabacteria bacterium]|nr:choice-of-anchor D domain-containing protein [Candidatus Kapabacteria bacterium]
GKAVDSTTGDQTKVIAVPTSTNSVFAAWKDQHGAHPAVYWTLLDSAGIDFNIPGGNLPVQFGATSTQLNPNIYWDSSTSNPQGPGAVIVWQDNGTGTNHIFAQRIQPPHTYQWTTSMIPDTVCLATGSQTSPKVIAGPQLGYYVVWQDTGRTAPPGSGMDIYAQRLDLTGHRMWGNDGKPVIDLPTSQTEFSTFPDNAGGFIVVWLDDRGTLTGGTVTIYAQRFDSSGTGQWQPNGVKIDAMLGNDSLVTAVPDGSGGAIIVWQAPKNAPNDTNIYAQRIDNTGTVQWGINNVNVCTATGSQSQPVAVSDGNGGAYIAWIDRRNGIQGNVYAQRIDNTGTAVWAANGIGVCTQRPDDMSGVALSPDGQGGIAVTWNDTRTGSSNERVYVQRVDPNGNVQWASNGIDASFQALAVQKNGFPVTLTWTSPAGPITDVCVLWEDSRNSPLGDGIDLYGDRIGFSPKIFPSPLSANFGSLRVATTGYDTIYARNVGDDTMSITNNFGFLSQGAAVVPFKVTNGSSFPAKVAPNDSTMIAISFTPQANTPVNDSMRISNNTFGTDSSYHFPVTGAGKYPHLTLSLDTVAFGGVRLGDTAKVPLLLMNTGTDTLHFTSETFQGQGASNFSDAGTNYAAVAPGDTLKAVLKFIPIATGLKSANYRITTDDSTSPDNIILSGTGTFPKVALTKGNVGFGVVHLNTTVQLTLGIINTGTDMLHIDSVMITGDTVHFTESGLTAPTTVAPGDTAFATISFKPIAVQTYVGTLVVVADDSIGKHNIELSGRGTNSVLQYAPGEIDYGTRVVNTPNDTTISVSYPNGGTDTAHILSATITG